MRLRLRDQNVSRRHAELRRDRRLADRGPRLDERGQGQRTPGRHLAAGARATTSRSGTVRSSSTSSSSELARGVRPRRSRAQVRLPRRPLPVPAGVARSALRDLRRERRARRPRRRAATPSTGAARVAATDASSSSPAGGGLDAGEHIDLFGGVTIGRATDADIRIEDRFASGIHCASTPAATPTSSRTSTRPTAPI